jgi:bifunctional enzyme CysN/CysC
LSVKPLFFDPYKKNRETGSFILIDPVSHNTCAVGMIIDKLHDKDLPSRITDREKEMIIKGQPLISTEERQQKLNQKAATLWITGLHGSGKNNLAYKLERKLFEQGASAVLMDGSTVRSGLSKELDYSPADRAEHLRRVAEVCKILNDQGIIVICSFISPKEIIRQQIADIIGKEKFHLIYMDADLDFCKNHKPEFYKKVEAGMLLHVPGIDEPFEKPENENLALYPEGEESNVQEIQNYLKEKKIFPLG